MFWMGYILAKYWTLEYFNCLYDLESYSCPEYVISFQNSKSWKELHNQARKIILNFIGFSTLQKSPIFTHLKSNEKEIKNHNFWNVKK